MSLSPLAGNGQAAPGIMADTSRAAEAGVTPPAGLGDAAAPPAALTAEQLAQFHRDGYLVIEGFCSAADCAAMRARAGEILAAFDPATEPVYTFSTVNQVCGAQQL